MRHNLQMPNEVINPATNAPYLTVEELSLAVKRTVETAFEYVRVRGEISQPRTPASGHIYLTLKDDRNALSAVCLLYTSPSPRDLSTSRMPSSA